MRRLALAVVAGMLIVPAGAWVLAWLGAWSVAWHAPRTPNLVRPSTDVLLAGLKVYWDAGFYPRVPQFARTPPRKPDWQLYWIVQHGVRYSGMAAWGNQIPDSSIWQVVTFLSRLDSLPQAVDAAWRSVGG